MGLIQALFRAFRIVLTLRSVPSIELGPETRILLCVSRKYALKRLQGRSWASASEVEQRAMLEILLIPLMKASSSPRYQSSTPAGTAREKGDPWGSCWDMLSPLVHQLWRFSLQQRRQVLVLSYFLLYNSYTVSYLISCLPLFCFVFLLLCFRL